VRTRAFVALLILLLTASLASCGSGDHRGGGASDAASHAAAARGSSTTQWSVPLHAGRVLAVAPRGSDRAAGSLARPFRTVGHALKALRPGDVLYVRGGTYHERVKATNITPGRPDARILVLHYPHERPVIEGQLWLAYPSYWTIDGINVTWAPTNPKEHMVQVYGGTGWVLEHSEIWGQGAGTPMLKSGLLIGDGRRNNLGTYVVRDNCIHDNETNVYLDDFSQSPDPHGTIERNVIFNAYDGRGIKLGPPGDAGGPKDVTIRYNTIRGGVENISLSREAADNVIARNILDTATEANVGSFDLRGPGNVVRDNVGFGAPRFSDLTAFRDRSNRTAVDPGFDALACNGFRPRNPAAQAYGRYAPAS
jgi:hypothetical protein